MVIRSLVVFCPDETIRQTFNILLEHYNRLCPPAIDINDPPKLNMHHNKDDILKVHKLNP